MTDWFPICEYVHVRGPLEAERVGRERRHRRAAARLREVLSRAALVVCGSLLLTALTLTAMIVTWVMSWTA